MFPPNKELLLAIRQQLCASQFQPLDDYLIEQLGEQEFDSEYQATEDVLARVKHQMPRVRRFQPRTSLLVLMYENEKAMEYSQDYQPALTLYNQLLRRKFMGEPHIILYNIAMLESKLNQFDSSIFHYTKSLRLKPGFPPSTLNYSLLLSKLNRIQQAHQLLDIFLKYYPSSHNLQLQYIATSSKKHYHVITKRYRGRRWHFEVMWNLAVYLRRIGKGLEAEGFLRAVEGCQRAKEKGLGVRARVLRGRVYEENRMYGEALEVYQSVLDMDQTLKEKLEPLIANLQQKANRNSYTEFTSRQILKSLSPNHLNCQPSEQSQLSCLKSEQISAFRARKFKFLLQKQKQLRRFFQRNMYLQNREQVRKDLLQRELETSYEATRVMVKEKQNQQALNETVKEYLSEDFWEKFIKQSGVVEEKVKKTEKANDRSFIKRNIELSKHFFCRENKKNLENVNLLQKENKYRRDTDPLPITSEISRHQTKPETKRFCETTKDQFQKQNSTCNPRKSLMKISAFYKHNKLNKIVEGDDKITQGSVTMRPGAPKIKPQKPLRKVSHNTKQTIPKKPAPILPPDQNSNISELFNQSRISHKSHKQSRRVSSSSQQSFKQHLSTQKIKASLAKYQEKVSSKSPSNASPKNRISIEDRCFTWKQEGSQSAIAMAKMAEIQESQAENASEKEVENKEIKGGPVPNYYFNKIVEDHRIETGNKLKTSSINSKDSQASKQKSTSKHNNQKNSTPSEVVKLKSSYKIIPATSRKQIPAEPAETQQKLPNPIIVKTNRGQGKKKTVNINLQTPQQSTPNDSKAEVKQQSDLAEQVSSSIKDLLKGSAKKLSNSSSVKRKNNELRSQKETNMNDRYNQERSIREIMTNPSFASCKFSFGDEDDPIDDKNLDFEYVSEVEKLLETSNHNKVLAIYKKEYKNAVGSEQKAHILLKIAFVFEKSDQLDYALKTYEKCLKLGSNTKAFVRLGDLQILKGDIEEGIDNLQKAVCILRNSEEVKLKLAYGYSMMLNGLSKALSITNEILLRDPTNLRAIMLSSNIHQKLGNIDIALKISQAIDANKSNESIKHYIGLLHLQKQDIGNAYACFKQALKINPRYVPSMVQSASILSTSDPHTAAKLFQKALQIQPQNLSGLTRLARLYQTQLSNNQLAIQTYQKVLYISQTSQTYQHLGNCLYKQKRYQDAINHFKKAITLHSTPSSWRKIAECYEQLKQYNRALNYYEMMSTLEPSAEIFKKIGLCMIYVENLKGAIKNLRQSANMEESAECYSLLANCYYLLEEYDSAIENYQKSVDLNDKSTQTLYNMAICYDQKEQFMTSKAIYEMILQEQPNNVNCLYNLGNIMLVLGKNNEALGLFERGLGIQPSNYARRLQIIDLYETLNDLNRAESHLLYCYRQNDQDYQIIQKLIRIYRKKKDIKKVNKFQKILLNIKSPAYASARVKTQH